MGFRDVHLGQYYGSVAIEYSTAQVIDSKTTHRLQKSIISTKSPCFCSNLHIMPVDNVLWSGVLGAVTLSDRGTPCWKCKLLERSSCQQAPRLRTYTVTKPQKTELALWTRIICSCLKSNMGRSSQFALIFLSFSTAKQTLSAIPP